MGGCKSGSFVFAGFLLQLIGQFIQERDIAWRCKARSCPWRLFGYRVFHTGTVSKFCNQCYNHLCNDGRKSDKKRFKDTIRSLFSSWNFIALFTTTPYGGNYIQTVLYNDVLAWQFQENNQ